MAIDKKTRRKRVKMHLKKKLFGTADKPRVFLFKSNRYIYSGVADDSSSKVFYFKRAAKNINDAKKLGGEIGKFIKGKKIEMAIFDRSGYKYHGRVAAIADGVREAGIKM